MVFVFKCALHTTPENTLYPQLGLGIKLGTLGVSYITSLSFASSLDCILLGILSACLALLLLKNEQSPAASRKWYLPPAAVTLFVLGVVLAGVTLASDPSDPDYDLPLRFFGPPVAYWAVAGTSPSEWRVGLFDLALPQLPLTTLNSVVSVCALAHSLYPDRRSPRKASALTRNCAEDAVISRRSAAMSVGLMNSVFCLLGGMPNCHGAGGLAGQHKFGARTGASIMFLGLAKMGVGVFFGGSALTLLEAMPQAVLGVLLGVAGASLALTGLSLTFYDSGAGAEAGGGQAKAEMKSRLFVLVGTAVVIVGTGKTHYGVVAGLVAYVLYGDGAAEYARLAVAASSMWGRGKDGAPPVSSAMPNDTERADGDEEERTKENSV